MGLFLEMFNSGGRDVQNLGRKDPAYKQCRGSAEVLFRPELRLPCFTTKKHPENRTGDQQ